MPTLDTFRLLGRHLIGALAGIYIAAGIARLIASFWPGSRLTAFLIASGFFVFAELGVAVRELRKGRLSTGVVVLDFMPFLLLGAGVSLFLGKLIARWSGSDVGGFVAFAGVYFSILFFAAFIKAVVQDEKLKEDLKQSPPAIRFGPSTEPGNKARDVSSVAGPQGSCGLSYDGETPTPKKWRVLQNIAKTLLVLFVIALMILLLSLIFNA